jgi:predicted nucleic acid-binding protein
VNTSYVVDSFAVMAWLKDAEPASAAVGKILSSDDHVAMSAISVGEIFYTLQKHFMPGQAELFLDRLPNLPIEIVTPAFADILDAASLKARHPIAYADAFAVQLALKKRASLVTSNQELRGIPDLQVVWLDPAAVPAISGDE